MKVYVVKVVSKCDSSIVNVLFTLYETIDYARLQMNVMGLALKRLGYSFEGFDDDYFVYQLGDVRHCFEIESREVLTEELDN